MATKTFKKMSGVDQIRALQKAVPANKNCAVCKDRGPTYICTSFNTFVCSVCSGLHREFGHKIKSISLSEWNALEVQTIENGGNEANNKVWLARWSPESLDVPNSTKQDTVRNWIQKVYVDKCYWEPGGVAAQTAGQKPASASVPAAAPPTASKDSSTPCSKPGILVEPNNTASKLPVPRQETTVPLPGPAMVKKAGKVAPVKRTRVKREPTEYTPLKNAVAEDTKSGDDKEKPAEVAEAPAEDTAATAPPPHYVTLSTNTACYCEKHNTSQKRRKQDQPSSKPCIGCHNDFMTTYDPFSLCPNCSGEGKRCMICGDNVVAQMAAKQDQFDPSSSNTAVGPMIDLLSFEEGRPKAAGPDQDKWEANFSVEAFPDVPGSPAGQGADLFDDTFKGKAAKRKSMVGAPSPESKSNGLDVLDLDFSQPAGQPNKQSLDPSTVDKKETTELGQQLREAVWSGSDEDIMKLFQQAKPKKVEVVDPTRSAKYTALQDDELNAIFNGASFHAEQESTSASDCGGESVTTSEDQPKDLTQVPESSVTPTGGESPSVAHFFIGDDDEDSGDKMPAQQLSTQQLSQLVANQKPQQVPDLQTQLSSMGPQQLQEMQSMINQMLQQPGASATTSLQPAQVASPMQHRSQGTSQAGGYASGCSATPIQAGPQVAPHSSINFGGPEQLNQLFADSKATFATSAPGNKPRMDNVAKFLSPGYVTQESINSAKKPDEFGDLLSAFNERNPIAGLAR